jgi:nucleoid DNA-binding protein
MVNELVKIVAKKANLSEPIAKIAVDTVINSLKSKLPPSASGILNTFLSSGSASASASKSGAVKKTVAKKSTTNPLGDLGNLAGALGGLLGKK